MTLPIFKSCPFCKSAENMMPASILNAIYFECKCSYAFECIASKNTAKRICFKLKDFAVQIYVGKEVHTMYFKKIKDDNYMKIPAFKIDFELLKNSSIEETNVLADQINNKIKTILMLS